jgi:MFS family permease
VRNARLIIPDRLVRIASADRDFSLLVGARAVSTFGSSLAPIALAFAVIHLTGSPADLGLVVAATMAPRVVFMLAGGVWADRLRRNVVMAASNVLSAATQAGVAALLLTHTASVSLLALLGVALGASSAFFFPASAGVVPQLVSHERLRKANAVLRLATNSATVGGGLAAGILVAAVGPGWAVAADAATYALGAAIISFVSLPPRGETPERHFWRELSEGWREFRSRRWVWSLVAQFALINAFGTGSFLVLGPFVAQRSLGGPVAWSAIAAAQAAGMIGAGFVVFRLRPARPMFLGTLAVLLLALPLALLAAAASLPLIILGALFAGAGIETFSVLWDTSLQQHIPPEKLSRVTSYDFLGSFALTPVGVAIVGPLASVVGVAPVLAGAAVLVVAATLAVLAVGDVRALRDVRVPEDAGPAGLVPAL